MLRELAKTNLNWEVKCGIEWQVKKNMSLGYSLPLSRIVYLCPAAAAMAAVASVLSHSCVTPQNSSILNWMNCYSYLLGLRNQLETSWQTTGANHVIWEKLNKMQKAKPKRISNTMIIKDNCIHLIDFSKSVVYAFRTLHLLCEKYWYILGKIYFAKEPWEIVA